MAKKATKKATKRNTIKAGPVSVTLGNKKSGWYL